MNFLFKKFHKYFYFFNLSIIFASCQLIVNVKNKGGEIYRETIEANTTADSIKIKFQMTDGTPVTQLIDIKNEIQIFKALILPEEDLGYSSFKVLCFVFRFSKNEFISSDAMSKLRQKNPSAIRHPEEDLASDVWDCDVKLDLSLSNLISPHIWELCEEAINSTYSKSADLKLVSQILSRNYKPIEESIHRMPTASIFCRDQHDFDSSCICHYNICTGWYPCGLKYCKGKDSANRIVNYRCGIKTCSKCRTFNYFVDQRRECSFDLPLFSININQDKMETEYYSQSLKDVSERVVEKNFADDEDSDKQ